MLFVFTSVSYAHGTVSTDMCSLLYSFLSFGLSIVSYVGVNGMSVIVVVVIGFIMVGTKQHENVTTIRRQAFVKLKDCQFGCNSRATTKGHPRMPSFFYFPFLCCSSENRLR